MMLIVNFDMIRNELSEVKLKQYQEIDHQEIKSYPPELRFLLQYFIMLNGKVCM